MNRFPKFLALLAATALVTAAADASYTAPPKDGSKPTSSKTKTPASSSSSKTKTPASKSSGSGGSTSTRPSGSGGSPNHNSTNSQNHSSGSGGGSGERPKSPASFQPQTFKPHIQNALDSIDQTGRSVPKGKGKSGGTYQNRSQALPTQDRNGAPVSYKEHDVNNKKPGQNREERYQEPKNDLLASMCPKCVPDTYPLLHQCVSDTLSA